MIQLRLCSVLVVMKIQTLWGVLNHKKEISQCFIGVEHKRQCGGWLDFDFVPNPFPVQEMPQEVLINVCREQSSNLSGVWIWVLVWISNASSSADGYLSCFYLLSIMNNAAINIHVQVFVWTFVLIFWSVYLGVESLGLVVNILNPLRNSQTVFQSGCTISYIFAGSVWGFHFPYVLINACYLLIILAILVNVKNLILVLVCMLSYHVQCIFMCLSAICILSLEKCLFISFCLFQNLVVFHWIVRDFLKIYSDLSSLCR